MFQGGVEDKCFGEIAFNDGVVVDHVVVTVDIFFVVIVCEVVVVVHVIVHVVDTAKWRSHHLLLKLSTQGKMASAFSVALLYKKLRWWSVREERGVLCEKLWLCNTVGNWSFQFGYSPFDHATIHPPYDNLSE